VARSAAVRITLALWCVQQRLTRHRARLVPGWVIVCGNSEVLSVYTISWYVTKTVRSIHSGRRSVHVGGDRHSRKNGYSSSVYTKINCLCYSATSSGPAIPPFYFISITMSPLIAPISLLPWIFWLYSKQFSDVYTVRHFGDKRLSPSVNVERTLARVVSGLSTRNLLFCHHFQLLCTDYWSGTCNK